MRPDLGATFLFHLSDTRARDDTGLYGPIFQQRSGLCSGVRVGSMMVGGMNSTWPGWMRISQPV
jgi:hypothetical protein